MTDLNITEEENWDTIYQLSFKRILSAKLQSFQYKLNLRILDTNSMLLKCGLSETELCSYCFETKESLIHLFYECRFVRSLWLQFTDNLRSKCGINGLLDVFIMCDHCNRDMDGKTVRCVYHV